MPEDVAATLKWIADNARPVRVLPDAVVNPTRARTLLQAIRDVKRSGERLFACYACSYSSALRAEEAVNLRRANVIIPDLVLNPKTGQLEPPEDDRGELRLRRSAPHAGKDWTNNGDNRDDRGLKHRPDGAVRRVPIPPALTKILRDHLDKFPPDKERRLFYGERGGEIPVITYNRVWQRARAATFTEDVLALPLAATPYTMRHAAVSTWLNDGVPATQVAAWAGHSVKVLLKAYAKCLHGQDRAARQRMVDAVG